MGTNDQTPRDATHLAAHLRTTMTHHDHTAASLARTAGLSPQYLNHVLNGKQRLSTRVALLLEDALHTPGLGRTLLDIQTTTEINRLRITTTQDLRQEQR